MPNELEQLSVQLQRSAALYDLDTAETEALTALESTVTASHSPNSTQKTKALTNGLKELPSTMNSDKLERALVQAILQSMPGVRYGAIVERVGGKRKVVAYLR